MKSSYDSRRAPWRGIVTNGVGEVEVDGRRFDAGMAEQDLHDAEINALFEQAGGEAVAEHRAYPPLPEFPSLDFGVWQLTRA